MCIYLFWGFPGGAVVKKNLPANTGGESDTGLIPGVGGSSGEGDDNPSQYSCWEIPWTEEPGHWVNSCTV